MTLLHRNNHEALSQGNNQLFPIFLKLNELRTVLIGAGNIGLEKLTAIINNSSEAQVIVIARSFLPEVHAIAAEFKNIRLVQKSFTPHDLDNTQLVIAATNDNALNEQIRGAAQERNLLVNIADKPALCDFYLGSIVQKGDLKLAISTNGKSPTVAKRLKQVLNESIPDELDLTLQQINQIRNSLAGDFAAKVQKLNELTAILIEKNNTSTSAAANNVLSE